MHINSNSKEEIALKKSTFFHLPSPPSQMPFSTNLAHYHYYQTKFLHAGPFQFTVLAQNGDGDSVAGQVQLLDELRQQVEAQRRARPVAASLCEESMTTRGH